MRDIIIQAAKITWRKRSLWFISILTIVPFIIANEWITAIKTLSATINPTGHFITISAIAEGLAAKGLTLSTFAQTFFNQPVESISAILSLAFAVALMIFFIWIVTNAQAIIISNVTIKKDNNKISINQSLIESATRWQNLAILNISYFLIKLFVITLFLILLIRIESNVAALIYSLAAFIIAIILMAFSFIIRLAIIHTVINGDTLKNAILKGKALFKKNIAVCYELSFIIAVVTIIFVSITEKLLLLIFTDRDFGLSIINILLFGDGWVTFLKGLLFLIVMVIVGGVVLLFQYTAWVRWFEKKDTHDRSYINKIFGILKKRKSK